MDVGVCAVVDDVVDVVVVVVVVVIVVIVGVVWSCMGNVPLAVLTVVHLNMSVASNFVSITACSLPKSCGRCL